MILVETSKSIIMKKELNSRLPNAWTPVAIRNLKPGSQIRRKALATAPQAISGEMGTYVPGTAEDRRHIEIVSHCSNFANDCRQNLPEMHCTGKGHHYKNGMASEHFIWLRNYVCDIINGVAFKGTDTAEPSIASVLLRLLPQ